MAISGINILIATVSIVAPIIYSGQTRFIIQKFNELLHWKLGCNPLPSVGNVSLHYFASRGRAEAFRLLMEDHMIAYTETKFNKETWPIAKAKGIADGVYKFGQVPAIITSKKHHVVQSKVILQYLGRSVGLDCDCHDLEKCDMIAAGVDDLINRRSKLMYNPDFSYAMRNEYVTNTLPTWLQYFETLMVEDSGDGSGLNYGGPYFASGRLTWLDYLVFDMIESNCNFIGHTIPDNETVTESSLGNCFQMLERFPHLGIFYNNFKNRINIAAYIISEKRIPYKIPVQPK